MGSLCGFDSYHWDLNGYQLQAWAFASTTVHTRVKEWKALPTAHDITWWSFQPDFCCRDPCTWCCSSVSGGAVYGRHTWCTKIRAKFECIQAALNKLRVGFARWWAWEYLRVLESTWEYESRSPWSKCHCVHRGPSRCQGSEDAHRGAGGSNDFRWCRCLRPLSVSLKPPASATADSWGVGTSCHSGLHRLEDTEAKNSSSLCERQLHSCNVRSVEKTTQSVVLKF